MKYLHFFKLFEWLEAAAIAIILAIVFYHLFWPYTIDGSSMENTLFSNDFVVVSRMLANSNSLKHGDIVVCKINHNNTEKEIVKRIIGLPNDRVTISGGTLYINNAPVKESYLKNNYTQGDTDIVLSDNEVYLLGDNRKISLDSRDIGAVSFDDIQAKVLFKIFPFQLINTNLDYNK